MGWLDNIGSNVADFFTPYGQEVQAQDTPYIQAGKNVHANVVGGTDFKYNNQGRLVNKDGQFVNNQGQLVDEAGELIPANKHSGNIQKGSDIDLTSINPIVNKEDEEYNNSLVANYEDSFKETGGGYGSADSYGGLNTNVSSVVGPEVSKEGPFKSLFSKMKKNWQEREGGLRNIGSAQFDEEAFLNVGEVDDEGKSLERDNPNYGKYLRDPDDPTKIIGKGEGLFGKEGGFMSKFGTGRGAMSGLLGSVGGEVGDTLSRMGEDMMYGGGYEYGDFYARGDE